LCISIMFAEWWSHLCIPTSFFDNHSHHVWWKYCQCGKWID
jgi:hypothetical protein